MQLGVKLLEDVLHSFTVPSNSIKCGIELTEMALSVVGIGFRFRNVLGHIGNNLANINGQSHVNVGLPMLKEWSTMTIDPLVIPFQNNFD